MPGFAGTPDNPPSNAGWAGDFSQQLPQILAPYQQMAQKLISPYATMRPDSWLAQNHPQVAGMLDNAFLTMGSTPQATGPEGFGGGLSRMAQGLMGAQQYKRQQAMQMSMLPYQMAMPQLQAMDTASQIGARQSTAQREQDYHEMITDRYGPGGIAAQKNQIEQQRADAFTNPTMLDHRRALAAAGLPGDADINSVSSDQLEKYNTAYAGFQKERQKNSAPTGGFLGQTATAMTGPPMPGESTQDYAGRVGATYTRLYGQTQGSAAGARTGAEQNVPHPYTDTQSFIKNERQNAYSGLEKPLSATDYSKVHGLDDEYLTADAAGKDKIYSSYFKTQAAAKQQMDVDLSKYEKSVAPSKGVSFSEYKQNPAQYDNAAPKSPAKSATAPAATKQLRWNPKTNTIE